MAEKKTELPREVIRKYLGRISWRRRAQLQQRGNFDEKYPEDPITAFLVSGNQFFDKNILIARKRELISFVPWRSRPVGENGFLRMFHPRQANRRYVIGADVAMGIPIKLDDPDYQAAVVLDLDTGEEMASYRAHVPAQDYAYDLSELGEYYNNAVIAVERSSEGGSVILTLVGDCAYDAIYKHRDWWKRAKKVLIDFEGFPMNLKTRPIALNAANRFVLESPELVWCSHFISEALTFVRNEKGIPAGMEGTHDDMVMAMAIAHAVRRVLLGWYVPWESKSEKYVAAANITDETVVA